MQRKSLLIVVVSLAVALGTVLAAGAQAPQPHRESPQHQLRRP